MASPGIRSQYWTPGGRPRAMANSQVPVYNAPNWQPPPKSVDNLHMQTRCWDEMMSLTIWINRLFSWSVVRLLRPPCLRYVADHCFGCVAKFCWHILVTHSTFLPLFAENNPQPIISLLMRSSICSCKLHGMMPSKMIENAKCFSREHAVLSRQSVRQTSPEVAATWVTSIPVCPRRFTIGTDRHSPFD